MWATESPLADDAEDRRLRYYCCYTSRGKDLRKEPCIGAGQRYSELDFFANAGVPVRVDDSHAIAHNKIILIDDHTIITGSFNFTKAAEESNAENLLVINGHDDLFGQYLANYSAHRAHSVEYVGRNAEAARPGGRADAGAPGKPRAPPVEDVLVYVTKTGSKYHREGCEFLKRSKIAIKLSEARAKYGPCGKCRP